MPRSDRYRLALWLAAAGAVALGSFLFYRPVDVTAPHAKEPRDGRGTGTNESVGGAADVAPATPPLHPMRPPQHAPDVPGGPPGSREADARGETLPQGEAVRPEDREWQNWLREFVEPGITIEPPPEYRGSRLAWRLTPPHQLTDAQLLKLAENAGRLDMKDRLAVVGSLALTGRPAALVALTNNRHAFSSGTTMLHGYYNESVSGLLGKLINQSRRRRKEDSTEPGEVDQFLDPAKALVTSFAEFARQRSMVPDPAGWGVLQRYAERSGRTPLGVALRRTEEWADLEDAVLAPLLDRAQRAPPFSATRWGIAVACITPRGAQRVHDGLLAWPELRAWYLDSHRVDVSESLRIFSSMLWAAWSAAPRDPANHERVAAWLADVRTHPVLTPEERELVATFSKQITVDAVNGLPALRDEVANWTK